MKKIQLTLMLALGALIISSCSKDIPQGQATDAQQLTSEEKQLAKDRFEAFSKVAVYNETMDKIIILESGLEKNDGFSFADPDDGWSFGSTDNLEFVEGPDGSNYVFINPNGSGANGQGGIVTAGNSTLVIDYAFCFSIDDEQLFGGLDGSAPIDGVSGVLGFSGDLEALANQDFEEEGSDPFEFFNGWAYYWVYADNVSGSYDILDWLDGDIEEEGLQDEGFAFVYDFGQGHLYWSLEGTLEVTGGQMAFDGEYWAWLDFLDLFFEGEDFNEFSIDEVAGSGSMGCQ